MNQYMYVAVKAELQEPHTAKLKLWSLKFDLSSASIAGIVVNITRNIRISYEPANIDWIHSTLLAACQVKNCRL